MEPRTLYPSRVKTLGLLLASVAFVAIGVWMILDGLRIGWLPAGFFGLCAVVFVVEMVPNASYLRIGPEGVEMRTLFRSHCLRWTQVDGFGIALVGVFPRREVVGINFAADVAGARILRQAAVALNGYEGVLPDVYGMKAGELAELLESYRLASEAD